MFIFIRFAATLLRSYATCDGTKYRSSFTCDGTKYPSRLRCFAATPTCDGECGEMRDENQTTFRKNGFQNGAIEGPFDRGKVLKEQVRFQRRS
jgi:hypothetical protein